MKRILITGANSYIGVSFEKYMMRFSEKYQVDTVDMIDGTWRKKSFSEYEIIFHVAGIAHIKETEENSRLYYEINRDMAVETAKKAKVEGTKQFIFLSTMSVYGLSEGNITKDTVPRPMTNYGKSKLEAEKIILGLDDGIFIVTVLRPPIVYGKGCKGNYQLLRRFALKSPIFPDVSNQRSMIYIDNLSVCVKYCIDNKSQGILFPQNKEFICSSDLVRLIAEINKHKILIMKADWLIKPFRFIGIIKKVFGSLVYDQNLNFKCNNSVDFYESIRETEK